MAFKTLESLVKDRIASMLTTIWSLTLASLIAGWLGRFHFLLDLACHFRVEQILVLTGCGIGLLCLKRKRIGAIATGIGLLIAFTLLPYCWGSPISGYKDLHSLTTINVLTSNTNRDEVIKYVRQINSDLVVFEETNQAWCDALRDGLSPRYPFRRLVPREDNFGIALFSKFPMEDLQVIDFSPQFDLPSIVANIKLRHSKVRLIATHPLPPVGTANWKDRNGLFEAVAKHVHLGNPATTIVAGDLNCTPWSHWFGKLLAQSSLRDSSIENGVGDTWSPFSMPLLGLPIDHVLIGSDIQIIHRKIGPDVGSDHRGVTVTFRVKPKATM